MRPWWALAVVVAAAPVLQSQTEVSHSGLNKGIALVRDGEYDAGLAAIEAALKDLGSSRGSERALGHLYAGVALVAKDQTVAAKTRFRRALEENPGLRIGPLAAPRSLGAPSCDARAFAILSTRAHCSPAETPP